MAISTSFCRPITSSAPLCFLRPKAPVLVGFQSSYCRMVINCCSSEKGPNSDPVNFRKQQLSSMSIPPFGVTLNDSSSSKPLCKWQRVLLQVSGEALSGDQIQTIDPKITMAIAKEVASVTRLGIEEKFQSREQAIDVEKFARYLPLHLIAVIMAWERDKSTFKYLLCGILLLQSMCDLASRVPKIEQIMIRAKQLRTLSQSAISIFFNGSRCSAWMEIRTLAMTMKCVLLEDP